MYRMKKVFWYILSIGESNLREMQLYAIIAVLAITLASVSGYIVGAIQQPNIQSTSPVDISSLENNGENQQRIIVVTGIGWATAEPSIAKVNLGVYTEASTAAEAVQQNAEKMSSVIEALKALGISEEDIKTLNYALSPIMDYESRPPRVVGYRASNVITITVRALDMVGQVIDVAVEAGANEVQSVTFTLTETESQRLKLEALQKAAENAKAKASTIASALNVEIIGVLRATESAIYYQPYRLDVMEYAKAPETPILPSDVQVSATIQVTYLIQ